MAEIDIEKKGPSAWPWLIGALLLALVVWGVAEWFDPDEPGIADVMLETDVEAPAEMQPQPETAPAGDASVLVIQYAQFADSFAAGDTSRQHQQTAEGLRQLVMAMGGVIRARQLDAIDVERRFDSFRQAAAGIQETAWTDDTPARQVKSTLTDAALALEEMAAEAPQVSPETRNAVAEARRAADSLNADQPLLEQRDTLRQFFSASARALNGLQNGT